jgi:hypothetical protein
MLAVEFEGSVEIKKPPSMTDEECAGLQIYQATQEDPGKVPQFAMAGIQKDPPYPFTITHWKPSKEDLEAMNAGRGIWVHFLSHVVFPMAVFTLDEAGEINQ